MTASLDLIRGRQVVVYATNKSGGALAIGDVVIVDTGNDTAVTTTTSANSTKPVGVVQEAIANNAAGRVAVQGYVSLVNVPSSQTRGQYLATHTVAKQATGAAARAAGSFAYLETGGTTPAAYLFGIPDTGTGMTNPLTTTGDIIYSSSGTTPARLAIGAATTVLHGGTTPAYSAVLPADLDVSADNTTSDATTGHHGLLLKLGGGTTNFLRADGTWNAPGGGGGVTVQYPALKPGTPTDDFAAASLAGAWSAHSSGGSFATTDCLTQGEDWIGSSLRMMFSNKMGALYRTQANVDFDVTWGGVRLKTYTSTGMMIGLAALNSSGTGVGVVAYNDNNCYLATITTWGYSGNSDSWTNYGIPNVTVGSDAGDWWFRLKRVSGTWTGYVSRTGEVWDKTFSTRADSITVDRIAIGLMYNPASTYYTNLMSDYFQQDV